MTMFGKETFFLENEILISFVLIDIASPFIFDIFSVSFFLNFFTTLFLYLYLHNLLCISSSCIISGLLFLSWSYFSFLSLSHTLSLTLSLSHTLSHTLSLFLSLSHSLSVSLSLNLSIPSLCFISLFQNELIPNSNSEEGKVFYYKMKGDYHRYLAEVRTLRHT